MNRASTVWPVWGSIPTFAPLTMAGEYNVAALSKSKRSGRKVEASRVRSHCGVR